jgi:malate dehydrogenase (oxaloacetate-decarboxylating)(NADP+)
MMDKDGIIKRDRENIHPSHIPFATNRNVNSLAEAIKDADVFLGLSIGGILTGDMVKTMASNPIVFALANPSPEISYEEATAARPDIILATGRSDYPNQVNNVLGFPYIFRGALDVRATEINEAMKLGAVKAIAELAKEPVPEIVNNAYGDNKIAFGKYYLIPKPLDPRLITTISPAVAKAAMSSGVAKKSITNWDEYEVQLQKRLGIDQKLISRLMNLARKNPKRVVFAEGENYKVLKAAQIVQDEGIAIPIILGKKKIINDLIEEYSLDITGCHVIDIHEDKDKITQFAEVLFKKRQRKGMTMNEASKLLKDPNYFGAMMVELGEADALISGLTKDYPKTILPSLQIIGVADDVTRVAGMYIIINKKGTYFFADTTVNVNPSDDELVDIIGLTAKKIRTFDVEPRIAMLSYSNFGSAKGDIPTKAASARKKALKKYPDLLIEGDIQANVAVNAHLQQENFPFSALAEHGANTLIFPDLASGNIAYKLLQEIGGAEVIGPVLMGMKKPVHVLQLGCSVREIVNMTAIAVVDAQLIGLK